MIVSRLCEKNPLFLRYQIKNLLVTFSTDTRVEDGPEGDNFRVLKLLPKKEENKKRVFKNYNKALPPRSNEMPVDQDWPSVWPGQRTFHPDVVPLPIRQGFPKKGYPIPGKYANTELMKIPNFLHLTPVAIKRHCEALKKFCTPWPDGLETEKDFQHHFPLEVLTSTYCYSSPSIREPLTRIVTYKVKLSRLTLDQHARDKILRLLGDRYDPETDYITITADRCPVRKQNNDYAEYLLTAVYNESWRKEPWEEEKTLVDMEYYDWEKHPSKTSLITLKSWPEPPTDIDYHNIPHAEEYKIAVSDLINIGEDDYSVNKYKSAVAKLLNLEPPPDETTDK